MPIIEKNIPLANNHKLHNYPFKTMDVGDSFAIPKDEYHGAQVQSQYHKRHGKQFTWRKQPDSSYRCWRVK